jgi:hypothetical protein
MIHDAWCMVCSTSFWKGEGEVEEEEKEEAEEEGEEEEPWQTAALPLHCVP